jgi:hypothetical protein
LKQGVSPTFLKAFEARSWHRLLNALLKQGVGPTFLKAFEARG